MGRQTFPWRRFWAPLKEQPALDHYGFLRDPDGPMGQFVNPEIASLDDERLKGRRCLVLLGEPGMGKTTALRDAVARESGDRDVIFWNLAGFTSEEHLLGKTFGSTEFTDWQASDRELALYLDSLDEGVHTARSLCQFLRRSLEDAPCQRILLRLACRSAEWPTFLREAFADLWGKENYTELKLLPLRWRDVEVAASTLGVDLAAFHQAVNEKRAATMASRPITLLHLLEHFAESGELPGSQSELYERICRRLCSESNASRRASRNVGRFGDAEKLRAAMKFAAYSMFCGRPTFVVNAPADLGSAGSLSAADIVDDGAPQALYEETLTTALFSPAGEDRIGWSHRTYAEFLAARFLREQRLSSSNVIDLLVDPETGRVLPQLGKTPPGWPRSIQKWQSTSSEKHPSCSWPARPSSSPRTRGEQSWPGYWTSTLKRRSRTQPS